jgi:hypothetical protein
MKRFYAWRNLSHISELGTVEALTICYNGCFLDVDNVYRDIESALKSKPNLPDCIYVIGNSIQRSIYEEAWKPESIRRESMLKRGTKFGLDFVKQYIFLEWTNGGIVKNILGSGDEVYEFSPEGLLTQGVFSLLEKNNAIHQAPSGHIFSHPSGNKNRLFIQAREIASDEAELFVVGYTIALKYGALLSQAKKVFIDTMGIYAYIRNALDICDGQAEILSFHSYAELEKLHPPSSPYFCIVSASTSGGMANTMKERQFAADRVVTMIDIKSSGRFGDVMVSLDGMGLHFPDLTTSEGTLIEIIGENFTSKAKPPRPVLLALTHAPDELDAIHEYFAFSIPPFNSSVEGGRTKLLYIDALPILKNDTFLEWLDAEINWSFPLTISHLICANDNASYRLASEILNRLKVRLSGGCNIKLVSHQDLENSGCESATGIVVVSAVCRDGGVLRDISRDLRSYVKAEIPRHFITPIGIPQSNASWKQLETFLIKNPTSRNYGFSNWIQMPIGDDSEPNTWTRLAALATTAQGLEIPDLNLTHTISSDIITTSLDLAADEIDSAYNGLLRSSDGKTLTLSEGFLFFAKDSEVATQYASVGQSVVYLTISAVLQSAREHKDDNRRLCPSGYESVVLGPECFMRFNDPLLQACLLRASLPSELNYSASPELSKLMKEFLSKVFIRRDKPFGAAALEFAAALAVGSLRLTPRDSNDLFGEFLKNTSEPSALFGLLILANKGKF